MAWLLADHQNSVRDIVLKTGTEWAVENHLTYTATGEILDETGQTDSAFAWTGRYLDAATAKQYNSTRWYDLALARWLSEDPIAFAGDLGNLYRYCGNDPVNWIDPSGCDHAVAGTTPSLTLTRTSPSIGPAPLDITSGRSTVQEVQQLIASEQGKHILVVGMDAPPLPSLGRRRLRFDNLGQMIERIKSQLAPGEYIGVLEVYCHANAEGFCLGPINAPYDEIVKTGPGQAAAINALYSMPGLNNVKEVWGELAKLPWRPKKGPFRGIIVLTGCNSGLTAPNHPNSYPQALADESRCIVVATGGYSPGSFVLGTVRVNRLNEKGHPYPIPKGWEDSLRPSEDNRMWVFFPRSNSE